MHDDKQWARRIAEGDKRAFEELVDSLGARIHRLARRYAAQEADAEDLTQEIFVDVFRCLPSFRGESSLSTWVYRIAINHCLKHQGRAASNVAASNLDEDASVDAGIDANADPMRHALRGELKDRVKGALDALSPLHRDIVILHELHELTYSECAGVLNVPIGTVKSRLSNAFRALRQSLGAYVLDESREPHPDALGEAL